MTLPSNYVPDVSIGNGVTTQFSGNWTPLNESWFRMVLEEIATGIQTPLSLGSDFTLVFDNSGYLATITSGAPSSAYRVIRYREVTIDQMVPYKTSKGFQGFVHESSFDKGIAISQDLSERLDRSITLPIGSTAVPQLAAPVPSNLIGWDSLGQNLINYVITDLSTYPVTTLGANIIGSSTPAEVRTLIEAVEISDITPLIAVKSDKLADIIVIDDDYTLTEDDLDKVFIVTAATPGDVQITIPDGLTEGFNCSFVHRNSANAVTFVMGGTNTLEFPSPFDAALRVENSTASILQISATEVSLFGDLAYA